MLKTDLSKSQLKDLNLFNLILECAEWEDPDNVEEALDRGEDVNPEGYRVLSNSSAILSAKFHAPVNMISLRISDLYDREHVQFHFLFDTNPERILEWLAGISHKLSIETYPELLKLASGKCEMILLEVSDTEIYEVKPPAGSASYQAE